jgi:hypothetical protein
VARVSVWLALLTLLVALGVMLYIALSTPNV